MQEIFPWNGVASKNLIIERLHSDCTQKSLHKFHKFATSFTNVPQVSQISSIETCQILTGTLTKVGNIPSLSSIGDFDS